MKLSFVLTQFLSLLLSFNVFANNALPVESLRDQGDTSHCWAYAMSHMLESRALHRENLNFVFDIEKDVKYWVDYERMLHIYRTKTPFYIGSYEGGWQIEFWDTLLKYGKHLHMSKMISEKEKYLKYEYPQEMNYQYGFMDYKRNPTHQIQDDFNTVKTKLMDPQAFKSEGEARTYMLEFLNSYYGEPQYFTQYIEQNIAVPQTAEKILGSDYPQDLQKSIGMVLVKPTDDQDEKWVKYLENRFWGYRINNSKVFDLIKHSLNKGWPVTYDNIYHAMTITGYYEKDGKLYFANLDSDTSVGLQWLEAESFYFNLLTFNHEAIRDYIGDITPEAVVQFRKQRKNYDQIDNMSKIPPGSFKK